jgi:hypothetical protein
MTTPCELQLYCNDKSVADSCAKDIISECRRLEQKNKITSALVNFGGDIYAIETKPNKKKFNIGITNPLKKDGYLFTIDIENQALTTSASYKRNVKVEDKIFKYKFIKSNTIYYITLFYTLYNPNQIFYILLQLITGDLFEQSNKTNP